MTKNQPTYDIFTIVEHHSLGEFIKEVNRFTKIGWKLKDQLQINDGKYIQVLTIKNNTIVWSSSESEEED